MAAYFDSAGLYSFGRQPEAVFWNLQQLAGCLLMICDKEPLVAALGEFSPAYRRELTAAMLERLALIPRGEEADTALVNAAFRALAEGGEPLRWEPFFFDWFGGAASGDRAMAGPRAGLYGGEEFGAFRALLDAYEPDRPERLAQAYFAASEPQELLYDEIEAIWAAIADHDDWSLFNAKLASISRAAQALQLARPKVLLAA